MLAAVTPSCVPVAGFQAEVAWQVEHCELVMIWVLAGVGVQPLPAVAWQVEQDMAPVWFIAAGAHEVPMAWQLAQALLVIGDVVCALAPLVGRPALGATAFTVL